MAGLIRFWGPVVLYMGLIFWSSSRPRPEMVEETPDFLLHGPAYLVLSLLIIRALAKGLDADFKSLEIAGGVALAIAYGMTDEWHQGWVAGRAGTFGDVALDAAGAIGGGALVAAYGRFRKSSRAERARPGGSGRAEGAGPRESGRPPRAEPSAGAERAARSDEPRGWGPRGTDRRARGASRGFREERGEHLMKWR